MLEALLNIFTRNSKPQSVGEILIHLAKSTLRPNKTTIYRQLEKLESQGTIRKVRVGDDSLRYEKAEDHHHHVVCTNCRRVEDVDLKDSLSAVEKRIAKEKKFSNLNHNLEFYGICSNCRN